MQRGWDGHVDGVDRLAAPQRVVVGEDDRARAEPVLSVEGLRPLLVPRSNARDHRALGLLLARLDHGGRGDAGGADDAEAKRALR
eukprot:5880017-Prymnesium_polylepis.1